MLFQSVSIDGFFKVAFSLCRRCWASGSNGAAHRWSFTSIGILSHGAIHCFRRARFWTDIWTNCSMVHGFAPHWHWASVWTWFSTTHYLVLPTRNWTHGRTSGYACCCRLGNTGIGHWTSIPILSSITRHLARTTIAWTVRWAVVVVVQAPHWHWAPIWIWCSTACQLVGSTIDWAKHRTTSSAWWHRHTTIGHWTSIGIYSTRATLLVRPAVRRAESSCRTVCIGVNMHAPKWPWAAIGIRFSTTHQFLLTTCDWGCRCRTTLTCDKL